MGEASAILADEIPPKLLTCHADTYRTRVFSQEVTFWAFVEQVHSEGGSCVQSVARVQQWHAQADLPIPSANTASYVTY